MYFIIASILLLSHVTLFSLLAEGGPFVKPSVILNTWELFWMEVTGKTSTKDLGGGMIGAILFAASYYLFDEAGSKIVSVIFIIIGIVLLTGKTLGDALGKFMTSMASFFERQWQGFIEDMKTWKKEAKEKKKNQTPKPRKMKEEPVAIEPEVALSSSSTCRATYFKLY